MRNTIKKILKENDFEWTDDVEPISVEKIWDKIGDISEYGANNWFLDRIAKKTHGLGLLGEELNIFASILKEVAEMSHDRGIQIGWEEGRREGYNEGFKEGKDDCEDDINHAKMNAHDEGYDEGYADGFDLGEENGKDQSKKEFNEIKEIVYNKGFEEGRMYEAGLDSEEYEKRQGGLDFEYEN